MTVRSKAVLFASAALSGALLLAPHAEAQTRAETLRQITGATINTLDPTLPGSTREAFGLSMSTYDRLVSFGRKKSGAGYIFDYSTIRGELAESYEVSPDGLKITFHLRKNAKFHDGSPVTAEDVKWSLDRDVAAKSLAAPQLLTGSLTKPEQFTIIDPYTVQVTLDRPDKLAVPNLATVYAIIINSKLAKQHATPDDPWAQAWLKEHEAGGGAYVVDSWKPGEQIVLHRFDDWKSGLDGKLPFFKRVIAQTIPEAATRANLIERGDADLSIDLQASDVQALESRGKVKIVSTPQFNAFTQIAFNTKMPPFDNVKVRQAFAAALPYEDMFKAALFGRGVRLFGANWTDVPPTDAFPQKMPLATDLDKARKLLTEAGYPEGLETTFSFNVGQAQMAEPMAALIKESLGKIGVKVEIQKLPDAQISTLISEKKLPFFTENSVAWLPAPDYLFRNFFTGDQRWNYSSWNNKDVNDLSQTARFERDPAKYAEEVKKLIEIDAREMPMILIWQANQDAVMVPSLEGYTYWFHRQVDFRDLSRS